MFSGRDVFIESSCMPTLGTLYVSHLSCIGADDTEMTVFASKVESFLVHILMLHLFVENIFYWLILCGHLTDMSENDCMGISSVQMCLLLQAAHEIALSHHKCCKKKWLILVAWVSYLFSTSLDNMIRKAFFHDSYQCFGKSDHCWNVKQAVYLMMQKR